MPTAPATVAENVGAVSRPHASALMLERQGSFRGFQKLSESSPFKRQLSLRINELPSTIERQRGVYSNGVGGVNGPSGKTPGERVSSLCASISTLSRLVLPSTTKLQNPFVQGHDTSLCIDWLPVLMESAPVMPKCVAFSLNESCSGLSLRCTKDGSELDRGKNVLKNPRKNFGNRNVRVFCRAFGFTFAVLDTVE